MTIIKMLLATQKRNIADAIHRAKWIMAGILGSQGADCKVREVLAAPNQLPAGSNCFSPSICALFLFLSWFGPVCT